MRSISVTQSGLLREIQKYRMDEHGQMLRGVMNRCCPSRKLVSVETLDFCFPSRQS